MWEIDKYEKCKKKYFESNIGGREYLLNDLWQNKAGSKIKEQKMKILTINNNTKLLLCK